MIIVGIDPGKSGGICELTYTSTGIRYRTTNFSGLSTGETARIVKNWCTDVDAVYLEKVWGRPGDTPTTAWSFAENYGAIKSGFEFSNCRNDLNLVAPVTWQRAVGIQSVRGESTVQKKRRHKALAQDIVIDAVRVTNATVDAILIAHFGKGLQIGF